MPQLQPFRMWRGEQAKRDTLGVGLSALLIPHGLRILDVAQRSGRHINSSGATVATTGQFGVSVVEASAWTNALTTDLDFTAGPWSVFVFGELTSLATNNINWYSRLTYTDESVNAGMAMTFVTTSGGRIYARTFANNGSASYVLSSTVVPVIGPQYLCHTSDGTTRRLYIDGQLNASTTTNPNPATTTGTLTIGSATNGQGIYLLAMWSRCLDPSEVFQLYVNPWALFVAPRVPLVKSPAAAAGGLEIPIAYHHYRTMHAA